VALKDNLFEKEETITQLAYVAPMALSQMVNDSYSATIIIQK